MEGMMANGIGNYKRTYPKQFGDSSWKWKSLFEWTSCISVTIGWLYIWLAYWKPIKVSDIISYKFSLV
jgi:hypothetical protein